MRVALAQIFCGWAEVEENLVRMARHAEEASREGASLVVFPELAVSGICKDPRVFDLAEDLSGPSVTRLSELARDLSIGLGFGLTERAPGKPYNSYCLIGPDGRFGGVYRKQYIPELELPFWQGAVGNPVFDFMGLRVAVSLCWDNTYPDLLGIYGRLQANCVLMPHAWDADALDRSDQVLDYHSMEEIEAIRRDGGLVRWKTHDEMLQFFRSYIPQLAQRHQFWALFVNQCGRPHPCLDFVGPSFAVDPEGRVILSTENSSESLLYLELAPW